MPGIGTSGHPGGEKDSCSIEPGQRGNKGRFAFCRRITGAGGGCLPSCVEHKLAVAMRCPDHSEIGEAEHEPGWFPDRMKGRGDLRRNRQFVTCVFRDNPANSDALWLGGMPEWN